MLCNFWWLGDGYNECLYGRKQELDNLIQSLNRYVDKKNEFAAYILLCERIHIRVLYELFNFFKEIEVAQEASVTLSIGIWKLAMLSTYFKKTIDARS